APRGRAGARDAAAARPRARRTPCAPCPPRRRGACPSRPPARRRRPAPSSTPGESAGNGGRAESTSREVAPVARGRRAGSARREDGIEARVRLLEVELDDARRSIPLLADDQLGLPFQLLAL